MGTTMKERHPVQYSNLIWTHTTTEYSNTTIKEGVKSADWWLGGGDVDEVA